MDSHKPTSSNKRNKTKAITTLSQTLKDDTEHEETIIQHENPWANLFKKNQLASCGMTLGYIPPTIVNGEQVMQ